MNVGVAKELFRQLAEGFFEGYVVIFSNQSRIAKPKVPLVVLTPGNISRPQAANNEIDDGLIIGHYLSKMPIVIDLFTNGTAVVDNYGNTVAYSNSAIDEMLDFANYLNSPKCVSWCNTHDVSILIETDVQDLTGIVNDNNYEYRSRMEVLFYFTQKTDQTIGDMGYFSNIAIEET